MNRYLLDSSAILDILKGDRAGNEIARLIEGSECFTSVVCYCEVLNKGHAEKRAIAKKLLSTFAVLPVSLPIGYAAEQIQNDCRQRGRTTATMDCLIAATALHHSAVLVASDSDFQLIEGIKKQIF